MDCRFEPAIAGRPDCFAASLVTSQPAQIVAVGCSTSTVIPIGRRRVISGDGELLRVVTIHSTLLLVCALAGRYMGRVVISC